MAEPNDTIRWYACDLIAVYKHTVEAMRRHAADDSVAKVPGAKEAVDSAVSVLDRHLETLEQRVKELGGASAVGQVKEAMTSVTGVLTGLYGQVRTQTASRILRDDYTGLSFVMTCASMLHTTAVALGNTRTASTISNMLAEFPPMLTSIRDALPAAVTADLAKDNLVINAAAAQDTVAEVKRVWQIAAPAR